MQRIPPDCPAGTGGQRERDRRKMHKDVEEPLSVTYVRKAWRSK